MIDQGHKLTDIIIREMTKKIRKQYKQANKEVEEKLSDYLRRFVIKDNTKRDQVARQVITQDEYVQWRKGQIIMGKRWADMKQTLANDYANSNRIANNIVKGHMPQVYAENINWGTYTVEKQAQVDTSFTLYDHQTVERLLGKNPRILPPPSPRRMESIRRGKDVLWNRQQIQNVMTQSILQGEAVPDIAKRLASAVGEKNFKAAIRNARTMATSAQNAGRLDSYRRAEALGIKVKKTWVATLDERTRTEHRILDGQTVPIDEQFHVNGYKLDCPADPNADPCMVYNCRCTMISQIEGFERDIRGFDLRNDPNVGDMTYDEWKYDRATRSNPIDLPIQKAEQIKASYIRGYRK